MERRMTMQHLTVAALRDRHDLAHLEVRPTWAITWRRATSPEVTTWPDWWRLDVREVACETCGGAA